MPNTNDIYSKIGFNGGDNLFDAYRNSRNALKKIDEYKSSLSKFHLYPDEETIAAEKFIKEYKKDASTSMGLSALDGLVGLGAESYNLSQIGNTNNIDNSISDINNIGRNYNSYDQISRGYSMLGVQPEINSDAIRGISDSEKVGNIASSTLTGATTGLSIGGPWGALVGGAVGLGTSLVGTIIGDKNAEQKEKKLKLDAYAANDSAIRNLNVASEYVADVNHRDKIANITAEGGKVERKQLSAKEFADIVMNKRRGDDKVRNNDIKITHCNGGVMVRIKR